MYSGSGKLCWRNYSSLTMQDAIASVRDFNLVRKMAGATTFVSLDALPPCALALSHGRTNACDQFDETSSMDNWKIIVVVVAGDSVVKVQALEKLVCPLDHMRCYIEPVSTSLTSSCCSYVQNHNATHAALKICTFMVACASPASISSLEACSAARHQQMK